MEYPSVTVRVRTYFVLWTDDEGQPCREVHEDMMQAIEHVEALQASGFEDAVIDTPQGERTKRFDEWQAEGE